MNVALLRRGSLKWLVLIVCRNKKVLADEFSHFISFDKQTNTQCIKSTCWLHVCHHRRWSTFTQVVHEEMNATFTAGTLQIWNTSAGTQQQSPAPSIMQSTGNKVSRVQKSSSLIDRHECVINNKP